MVVGQLELQLFANLSRLTTDLDKAKRTVGDTVDKINNVLGTIGIGISVAGFASLIKSTVDIGDKFNDLRKITGLTVEQLAGLDKAAALNGTNLDQVAKAVGIMSKNMVSGSAGLQALGVSAKQANGDFRGTGDVLLDVADRFSRMQDGVQKAALAQEIFGKSGRELIPLLNEGRAALQSQIETYGATSGMTTRLAEESDRFNDILTLLGSRVTAVKNTFVAELLPTLNNIGTAMLNSGSATNTFSFAAQVVVPVLKGLAIAGFTVVDTFRGMGREIGARAAQLAALSQMDFKGAKFIGTALAEDNAKARAEYDKFVDTILNSDKSVQQLTETQKQYLKIEGNIPGAVGNTTKALKEKKVLTDAEQLAILRQQESTKQIIALDQEVKRVTASVATEQEIYNQKLEELNRLKPYLSVETYERALKKLNETTKQTAVVARNTTDEVSQLWIQAGRNIQSTLANSIFNSFDDGLKGMVKNVISAVGRIASEFAALKIAQSIGLDRMFGMPGSGTSTAGKGFGFADIANMGSNVMGMFRSGGTGMANMIGRAGSVLPGSMGSFFGGMSGGTAATAARGATTLWGASGMTGAASAGAGMSAAIGAAAGPLMAAFAATQLFKSFAGDKRMGGGFGKGLNAIGDIPILGDFIPVVPLMNTLFGRGPYKFRQQSLQGNISSEGFDGDFTNVFKSKGGLFLGNKHKEITEQLSFEQQDLFDTTLKGFYSSAHNFAENLGLSTDLVDNFTAQVQIKSEKGKELTEEAIAEMLTGIGNDIAKNALPIVDSFKKAGENSFQTLTRLSGEFDVLASGAMNLGASISFARELIKNMSIESRTALVAMAGGAEKLNSLTSFFAQNFLTEGERLKPVQEQLIKGLTELGLAADMTNEQYKALVQSFDITDETRIKLLELGPALLQVNTYLDATKQTLIDTADQLSEKARQINQAAQNNAQSNLQNLFSDLQKSVEDERKKITDKYNSKLSVVNTIIQGITGSIGKLKSFSDSLLSTINNLLPMGRDAAKDQIRNAIRTGNFDGENLKLAIGTLSDKSTAGFSSSFEFAREQAKSVSLLSDLKSAADTQTTDQQAFLAELNQQSSALTAGFEQGTLRLDSMLDKAQKQIALLTGIDNGIKSLPEVLRNFNLASLQGGGGAITDPSTGLSPVASGNRNISNQAIIDYFNTPRTAEEIYSDQLKYGVTAEQIINTGRFTREEVEKFYRDTGIPRYASGGRHRGGLRIVGERGPEIERTGPSHITSNKDLKKSIGNDEVVNAVNKLVQRIDDLILGGTTGPALRVKTI